MFEKTQPAPAAKPAEEKKPDAPVISAVELEALRAKAAKADIVTDLFGDDEEAQAAQIAHVKRLQQRDPGALEETERYYGKTKAEPEKKQPEKKGEPDPAGRRAEVLARNAIVVGNARRFLDKQFPDVTFTEAEEVGLARVMAERDLSADDAYKLSASAKLRGKVDAHQAAKKQKEEADAQANAGRKGGTAGAGGGEVPEERASGIPGITLKPSQIGFGELSQMDAPARRARFAGMLRSAGSASAVPAGAR